MTRLLAYLPRGNTLDHQVWLRRHAFLQWVLLLHVVGLYAFGLWRGFGSAEVAIALVAPFACLVVGRIVPHRRLASLLITAGLVYCSAALVGFSGGSIEAHFHFFIMIGFIALYQDWVPFLWNIAFTVASHGIGSVWQTNLIFNHPAGQTSPWTWSAIHGVAVLAACIGVVVFWQNTETEQNKSLRLTKQLADAEITRRKFTADLLVNLARRNQSLMYRQLGLINQLEEQEKDPDALADLFRLDHLATRIRRNAESLLVLSGEDPPRTWGRPVLLVDVVRAAIAETEDLDRVVFAVDERLAVLGNAVADLTHLLAELVENAVHFSPPEASVIIRTRPYLQTPGAHVLTVEDWGVGIRSEDLAEANDLLANPRDVDLSVSQRLGLHVVARLAQRHSIEVSLTPTPGCGVTAAIVLPPELFSTDVAEPASPPAEQPVAPLAMASATRPAATPAPPQAVASTAAVAVATAPPWPAAEDATDPVTPDPVTPDRAHPDGEEWSGWWEPSSSRDGGNGEGGGRPAAASSPDAPGGARGRPPAATRGPAATVPVPPPPEPQLARRVPQAHLAPELRRQQAEAADNAAPPPDADQAREALSRYQASREAARALVDPDPMDVNGRPPDPPGSPKGVARTPPAGDGGLK
ncbi:MAG TPA: ATP-binding protein [Actinomycetota bacterium]|nr:ATP-binding protein [Actinomycetota bacterium]